METENKILNFPEKEKENFEPGEEVLEERPGYKRIRARFFSSITGVGNWANER